MAKLTDKLFNRVIEGKILPVASINSVEDASKVYDRLHVGDFILVEEVPSLVLNTADGMICALQIDTPEVFVAEIAINGEEINYKPIMNQEAIQGLINQSIQAITTSGLTHSFAELDETLRGIVESAISDGSASCTEAQWAKIKELLDKSLYFNYEGVSMIKTFTDGINEYMFGGSDVYNDRAGNTLHVFHSIDRSELSIQFDQL